MPPLRGSQILCPFSPPTACAVGYMTAPLRGWGILYLHRVLAEWGHSSCVPTDWAPTRGAPTRRW